jgi:hypothetical protein
MINKSKLALIAAVLAAGIASPAFAQSFDTTDGTGNEFPAYYGPHGGLHYGSLPSRIAVHRSGHERIAARRTIGSWAELQGGCRT